MNPEDRVAEQFKLFEAALPALLTTASAGRWVVFLDGVQGTFATESEAHSAGLDRFGIDGGFVVARVEHHEPAWLTAAYAFGIGT